ncbi:MAG TPA: hypothetical protein VFO84_01695 [Dehalococcoidia bacterium]|nr:hypothetical protein [Dehalococcoidia bacterium]
MDSGVVWRAVLGVLIIAAILAFVLVGFDQQQVDEQGDPVESQAATPRATLTPVLSGTQLPTTFADSPGRIEEFCRELQYAEPPCAGAVSGLCAELGAGHPECQQALQSYCAISLASAALCAQSSPAGE